MFLKIKIQPIPPIILIEKLLHSMFWLCFLSPNSSQILPTYPWLCSFLSFLNKQKQETTEIKIYKQKTTQQDEKMPKVRQKSKR